MAYSETAKTLKKISQNLINYMIKCIVQGDTMYVYITI